MISRLKKFICVLLTCAVALPLFLNVSVSAEVYAAPAASDDVIVNLSAEKQVIRGFGV